MTPDYEGFATWLEERGYRRSTARKEVTDLRTHLQNPDVPRRPGQTYARAMDYSRAWDDYQEYASAVGRPRLRGSRPPEAQKAPAGRRRRHKAPRAREAVSIDAKDWKVLRKAVKADLAPSARVLEVMMATGLRVGDVLRVPPTRIRAAFTRDDGLIRLELKGGKLWTTSVQGAPEAWGALAKVCGSAPTVAGAVNAKGDPSPEPRGPAYEAVRWRLQKLAAQVGLEGRVYLHRLRRTVAVRALRKGRTQEEVAKLLGHADARTTSIYTDESMADLAAKMQRELDEED